MSVQAISWVLDHSEATLGTRLVAISIANHADKTGADAWASVALYAEEAHLSERQTKRAIRELETLGEIRKAGLHGYRADRMTVVYEFPGMVDEVTNRHPAEPDGVTSTTLRGDMGTPNGVTPVSPKPSSIEPSRNRPTTFAQFFDAFPRHDDRLRAEKAYEKALKRATALELLDGARRYRDDPNREDQYTKQAATWLNAGSWENGPLPTKNGSRRLKDFANSLRERGM